MRRSIILCALLLWGCPKPPSDQNGAGRQDAVATPPASSVYERGDAVQALLQDRVRARLAGTGDDFQVYVTEIAYPIGTIMPLGRTIALSVDACKPEIQAGTYQMPNMFPSIAMKGKAAFDLGLDSAAISDLARFGVKAGQDDVFNLAVSGAAGQFLVDDQLRRVLGQPSCSAVVSSMPIVLVRGYVVGKRNFLLERDRNAAGDIGVTRVGGLKVEGSSGTSVSLQDEAPAQFLQIVSKVEMPQAGMPGTFRMKVTQPRTSPQAESGRVYIQRDQQDSSDNAAQLIALLQGQDFNVVPHVEAIPSNKMPRTAQVRYFHADDAELAERAGATLRRLYSNASTLYVGLSAPENQLEVWLPRVGE